MSTYIWRLSVALVRTLECVWLVKFIITLVYVYLEQVHGNSYDTPVSVLMLNMIFLVSPFFFLLQNWFPAIACLSHWISPIYTRTHRHARAYIRRHRRNPRRRIVRSHTDGGKHLLEFQFLLQAVPAEKRGCIGNYPLLHLAVTIVVRSCPVSMVQVCCPTRTTQCAFPHIRINRTLEIRFPPGLRNVILLYFNAPLCFIVGSINKTQSLYGARKFCNKQLYATRDSPVLTCRKSDSARTFSGAPRSRWIGSLSLYNTSPAGQSSSPNVVSTPGSGSSSCTPRL